MAEGQPAISGVRVTLFDHTRALSTLPPGKPQWPASGELDLWTSSTLPLRTITASAATTGASSRGRGVDKGLTPKRLEAGAQLFRSVGLSFS